MNCKIDELSDPLNLNLHRGFLNLNLNNAKLLNCQAKSQS